MLAMQGGDQGNINNQMQQLRQVQNEYTALGQNSTAEQSPATTFGNIPQTL